MGRTKPPEKGLSLGKMLAIAAAAMLVTMVATLWLIKLWLFPAPFAPVTLAPAEEQKLESKLTRLEAMAKNAGTADNPVAAPVPGNEESASREIIFSEKELNALITKNPELAGKVAIDLADNLVSATLLIPTKAKAPLLDGQAMRVKTGLTLTVQDGRPVLSPQNVSVMGVPMPKAWLGKLNNIDLARKYGSDGDFWRRFADGFETIDISDGQAKIVLKP
ncbi:MAG TPA: arginine N-succinyltransferase [Desulfobulbaceae bacterium]|nr:arginine N-succinyltransferase [Desulfobulbaceae bacterium]